MTSTDKPVRRVTKAQFRFGGKARALVAQLGPGDVLVMREHGRRYVVSLPLDTCYRLGVRTRVDAEKAERRAKRKR